MEEARSFSSHPAYRRSIPDVGGPTANMYGVRCLSKSPCGRQSCLWPRRCANLSGHAPMMEMLERLAALDKTSVRVASGVRHDLALSQEGYSDLLAARFTGGQLKVAPEHNSAEVLERMRKPPFGLLEEFEAAFKAASARAGKEQYLVPYFISGHPGCALKDAVGLYEYLKGRGWKVRQVQDFTPIPLTLSAAMHASGLDERMNRIHVPGREERLDQLALLRFHMKESAARISKVLGQKPRKKRGP